MEYFNTPLGLAHEIDESSERHVYIIYDHMGWIVGCYTCPDSAIDRAVEEVCADYQYNSVHVDICDAAIYVSGNAGELTIMIEKLH